jgi:phage terminase large subunit-like protein
MFIITTAGYNIEGPCYDKRREVVEMLDGTVPNDELFGWIWTVDPEDDDWKDPKVLAKANPNIGVSVYQSTWRVSSEEPSSRRASPTPSKPSTWVSG